MHRPGIEPGPPAWQASILPLNQRCLIANNRSFVDRIAVVAEWLRRLTRNQFPSGSVGSNPTDCVTVLSGPPVESIVGSVVECSPATRAARVRFPDDARLFVNPKSIQNTWQSPKKQVLYYEYFCFLKLPPSCRQFSKKPFNSITLFRVDGSKKYFCQKVLGGAGYRSRYLSHAKRALYHVS